jgi:protein arginine kinase activator
LLCEYCGKNPVTTHVKTIINGELTKYSLCAECAQKSGYGSLLTGLGCNFGSLLGGFFSETAPGDSIHCKCCGSTFEDIARSGKVGCAECYDVFYDRLIPLIQRIHGSTQHRGKVPGIDFLQPQGQLSVMRHQLREAIEAENFEHAVMLRDCIKKLEEERHE